jgi:lipopolysaccharide/colanic/teichoic acid biosynthesis glycosyltransferase
LVEVKNESIISFTHDWRISRVLKVLLVFVLAVSSILVVAHLFSPHTEILVLISTYKLLCYSAVFGVMILFLFELFGIYEISQKNNFFRVAVSIFILNASSAILLVIIFWLLEYENIGRIIIFYIVLLSSIFHCLLLNYFSVYTYKYKPNIYLDVSNKLSQKIQGLVLNSHNKFSFLENKPFTDDTNLDILVKENYDDLTPDALNSYLKGGTCVIALDRFCQIWCRCIPPEFINNKWVLSLDLALFKPIYNKVKRLLDILIVGVLALFLVPLFPLIVFLIVIDSGWPVFYRQKRVGYLGHVYYLYKFRTMKVDSEVNGPQWTSENDSRITKLGVYLRKLRIDELPQFWNIIKGDMSLVGPRPERPEFDAELNDKIKYWRCRTLVKPGLTGWAQINSQYASDIDSSSEKLSFDLYYIKNKSFWLDLEIILSTLRSITKSSR